MTREVENALHGRDIQTPERYKRELGIDLLDVDPSTLSLKERLRRKRQIEKTLLPSQTDDPDSTSELVTTEGVEEQGTVIESIVASEEPPVILGGDECSTFSPKKTDRNGISEALDRQYWLLIADEVEKLVDPNEWQILQMVVEGKTNREIANLLNVKEVAVGTSVGQVRDKIEPLLLNDGLIALDELSNPDISLKSLQRAAREGLLSTIKVLRRWYTTKEEFDVFWNDNRASTTTPSKDVLSATRRFGDIVAEGIRNGKSVDEIAISIKRSRSLVSQINAQLKREGVIPSEKRYGAKKPGGHNKKDYSDLDSQVQALRDEGLEHDEIATLLGTSYSSVSRSVDRLLKAGKVSFRRKNAK